LNVNRTHAGQGTNRRHRLVTHLVLDRTGGRRQLDRETHPPLVDGDVLDEVQRDDVLAEIGVDDDTQRFEDGVTIGTGGHIWILARRRD
jgi:hypothetical protein